MKTLPIEDVTWKEFRKHVKAFRPKIRLPTEGCWPEVKAICEKHELPFAEYVRQAEGKRAWVIYGAYRGGFWPEDTFVQDIREAPGDRAGAIFAARRKGFWPEDTFVQDLREAPGDREWAIRWARRHGIWPKNELD